MDPLLLRVALLSRRPATLPPGADVPPIEIAAPAAAPDAARLRAFRAACGLPDDGRLPPTWPQVLATPLHLRLLTSDAFPVRVLGLVHVAQRIALRAPLPADARLALRCAMAGHREVDAGQAFELHTVALADGVPAWRATTTFVARQPRPRGASGPSRGAETAPARAAPWAGATVDVPADTGRRYARASGDWNPIHLWGWTARPFGFDRPIAHGMWTLARALGAIDAAHPAQADAARTVDVRFGRPLRLPGTVRVSHGPLDDGAIGFEVAGTDDGRPHASGRVAAGWHDDGPSGPP